MIRNIAIFFHNISVKLGYEVKKVNVSLKITQKTKLAKGTLVKEGGGLIMDFNTYNEVNKWTRSTVSFYLRIASDDTFELSNSQIEVENNNDLNIITKRK